MASHIYTSIRTIYHIDLADYISSNDIYDRLIEASPITPPNHADSMSDGHIQHLRVSQKKGKKSLPSFSL
jgi:hypothetical protein